MIAVDLPEYRQKHILRAWYGSNKSAHTIASELAATPAQVIAVIHNARLKAKPNAGQKQ